MARRKLSLSGINHSCHTREQACCRDVCSCSLRQKKMDFETENCNVCLATLTMNFVVPSSLPIDDRSVVTQAVIFWSSTRVFAAKHMRSVQVRRLHDFVHVESIFRATVKRPGPSSTTTICCVCATKPRSSLQSDLYFPRYMQCHDVECPVE
jgi:hypothetical protein